MEASFELVFRGELLDGFRLEDVKRSLSQLLALDDARATQLFSGGRTVLKRSLTPHDAARYAARLAQLGMRVHLEPMSAGAQTPGPAPATPPPPAPDAAPRPLQPMPGAAPVEEIVCPNCGERQPKRILCRSCATDMPMGIAAKLEKEEAEREARRQAFRARHGMKSGPEDAADDDIDPEAPRIFGLGFSGRMGRVPFATANAWLFALMLLLTFNVLQRPTLERGLVLVLGTLVVFVLSMRLAVLRCHDCGVHGWWTLFTLIPYAGFFASLLLSFMPGNESPNEYGGLPRRGRWRWLAVAVLIMLACAFFTVRAGVRVLVQEWMQEEQQQTDEPQGEDPLAVLPGWDATVAFHEDYLPARNHKAFAVSAGKGWGYHVGAASPQEAGREALARCQARREPYTPPCNVVNLNGRWLSGEE